jgi:hypothetical protein
VIYLAGTFPDAVTVYRTRTGAQVQAGCQNFGLDEDLEEIAAEHDWDLPTGWKALVQFVRDQAASWH